jgi:hypothetical protein
MSSRPRARREMGVRHRWSGEPLLVTQSHFPSNLPRCRPSAARTNTGHWTRARRMGQIGPEAALRHRSAKGSLDHLVGAQRPPLNCIWFR